MWHTVHRGLRTTVSELSFCNPNWKMAPSHQSTSFARESCINSAFAIALRTSLFIITACISFIIDRYCITNRAAPSVKLSFIGRTCSPVNTCLNLYAFSDQHFPDCRTSKTKEKESQAPHCHSDTPACPIPNHQHKMCNSTLLLFMITFRTGLQPDSTA